MLKLNDGSFLKGDNVRIVAVNPHHNSGEVELVLEFDISKEFESKHVLKQIWVDVATFVEMMDKLKMLEDVKNA